jgi:hypothetical protein
VQAPTIPRSASSPSPPTGLSSKNRPRDYGVAAVRRPRRQPSPTSRRPSPLVRVIDDGSGSCHGLASRTRRRDAYHPSRAAASTSLRRSGRRRRVVQ